MAEQIPSGQEPQPSAEDVVVFSPELLKLAKQRQEHLEECRQAADDGDCAAAVQMGRNYLYGTGGVQKDPEQAFTGSASPPRTIPWVCTGRLCAMTAAPGWRQTSTGPLRCFRKAPTWAMPRPYATWACATKTARARKRTWTGRSPCMKRLPIWTIPRASAIWGRCIMPAWAWSRTMKRRPTTSPWQPSSSCPGRSIFWVCATSSATAWRRT